MCYRLRSGSNRVGMARPKWPRLTTQRCDHKENASMAAEAREPRRPDNIDVEVGRLVRVQRIARGLSQTELGDQIGVTFQQVQKYESGANRISMGRLTRISRVLGVDITYCWARAGG